MDAHKIKQVVSEKYSYIAQTSSTRCSCSCKKSDDLSRSIGYADEDIQSMQDANLGLGCGNPTALGNIKEGNVILDLGSGAGFDAFLAAKKVGDSGRVIGVDMTPDMIKKAEENALKYGYKNVEFMLGDIEELPLPDNSIDIIISNCVINLAPDKSKVFREAYRVLKENGKMYLSDIVLLDEIPDELKMNKDMISGCVGGALLKDEYIGKIAHVGFKVNILGENEDISKEQYSGLPLESLSIEAVKQ